MITSRNSLCFLAILLGIAVPAMASQQSQANATDSGIQGTVVRGPLQGGPQRKDRPASEPYQAKLVVKRVGDRHDIAEVQSDENGRFRVVLPPGRYFIVNRPSPSPYPRIYSAEIVVRPHQFTEVNLWADTGLR